MTKPPPAFTDTKDQTKEAVQILAAVIPNWDQQLARIITKSAKRHRISLPDLEQAATRAYEETNYPTWHEILKRTQAYNRELKWNPNQKQAPDAEH